MEAPADGDEEKMEPQDDGGRLDPPPPRVPPLVTQQLQDDSQGSSGDGCVSFCALCESCAFHSAVSLGTLQHAL